MNEPVNGKPMTIEEVLVTPEQKAQAESFFKVLVKKGYDVPAMADILQHMGRILVEYAREPFTAKPNKVLMPTDDGKFK